MEGTIAEIRMFAGNFEPRNWAYCQNQLLQIASNTALFSLLGTTYGGNGTVTFALPDFRGRIPVGTGSGPGLPVYQLGQLGGTASVTLQTVNLPSHTHPLTGAVTMQANNDSDGASDNPTNKRLAASQAIFTGAASDLVPMAPLATTQAIGNTGGGQSFSNMPPCQGMNYIICLYGVYPSRN